MLLSLLAPALAVAPDAAATAALTGDWRLAETRADVQARVDASIEAAIAPFNAVIRGLARSPVRAAAFICDTYHTVATASTFTVGCDGRGSATAAFGAPPSAGTGPDGHAYTVSATWGDGATLVFVSAQGSNRVTYRPDAAGNLRVHKTIHVDRLDRDVAWEALYARAAGP
jgi:hypothetical protein